MSLTDYSNLEQEIKDAPEPKILPRGSEVKARIITVRSGVSERGDNAGAQWYQPVFDIPSEPLAKEFNDFFWDLASRDILDEKSYMRALRKFKSFAESFNIDYTRPFDWEEDLIGKEGWVILGIKKSDEYGDGNTVQKYIAGR